MTVRSLRSELDTFGSDDAALLRACAGLPRDDRYDFVAARFDGGRFDFDYHSMRLIASLDRRAQADTTFEYPHMAVICRRGQGLRFIVFDYSESPTMGSPAGDIFFRYEGPSFEEACEILPMRSHPEVAAQATPAAIREMVLADLAQHQSALADLVA